MNKYISKQKMWDIQMSMTVEEEAKLIVRKYQSVYISTGRSTF